MTPPVPKLQINTFLPSVICVECANAIPTEAAPQFPVCSEILTKCTPRASNSTFKNPIIFEFTWYLLSLYAIVAYISVAYLIAFVVYIIFYKLFREQFHENKIQSAYTSGNIADSASPGQIPARHNNVITPSGEPLRYCFADASCGAGHYRHFLVICHDRRSPQTV